MAAFGGCCAVEFVVEAFGEGCGGVRLRGWAFGGDWGVVLRAWVAQEVVAEGGVGVEGVGEDVVALAGPCDGAFGVEHYAGWGEFAAHEREVINVVADAEEVGDALAAVAVDAHVFRVGEA